MHTIDLRSDTVTRPCAAMRKAMHDAPVGDDVFDDDPTVNRLQDMLAERTGMEAAIYASSGTQSNLLGLLSHCERGDEYLVGQAAHTYLYEGGGGAVLGSIQPQPVLQEADGTIDLDTLHDYVKDDDIHFAKTRLLALENTWHGNVMPMSYIPKARAFADQYGLGMHLDGARACNAAVKLGVELKGLTQDFDSVSICLSKGLGAPVGSLLCGSKELIKKARRWRKMLGGGMRQAGVIAAAGIFAMEHNFHRLAEDHENASNLAQSLRKSGFEVEPEQTNIVYVQLPKMMPVAKLQAFMAQRQILITTTKPLRLVMHKDIQATDLNRVIDAFNEARGHFS